MSKFPEIFAKLTGEFQRAEVKTRPQGGRQLQYVTARTVMNRLDYVLGPENWWDEYLPMENSVLCKLSVRLPDGSVITKSDAGGYAGMSDQGDDDKSGYSDAFKRAAVKFGVGRYLYCDGVPEFKAPAVPLPVKTNAEVKEWANRKVKEQTAKYQPKPPEAEPIAPGEHAFEAYLFATARRANDYWRLVHSTGHLPPPDADVTNMHSLGNYLGTWAEDNGRIKPDYLKNEAGTRDRGKLKKFLARWYTKYRDEFEQLAEEHISEKLEAAMRAAGLAEEGDPGDLPEELVSRVDGHDHESN